MAAPGNRKIARAKPPAAKAQATGRTVAQKPTGLPTSEQINELAGKIWLAKGGQPQSHEAAQADWATAELLLRGKVGV